MLIQNAYDRLRSLIDSSASVPIPVQEKVQFVRWRRRVVAVRTDEFHRTGPTTPTTRVLVSGHGIPRDAMWLCTLRKATWRYVRS